MITIPKQHYVGLRSQKHGSDNESDQLPLGFATPYDDHTTKAFEKRKSTVDSWSKHGLSIWDPETKTYIPTLPLDAKIVDNSPVEGFRIAQEVRRVYWGGGNVVWRIEDPRGYELEISSSNLARILDCSTIKDGVIEGKCVWGRDKAQNILLPENSEPYKEAMDNTIRASTKVSLRDVSPGDVVLLKDGRTVTYLGLFNMLYTQASNEQYTSADYHRRSYYTKYDFIATKKRYIFKEVLKKVDYRQSSQGLKLGDTVISAASDLTISSIVQHQSIPLDLSSIADEVNQWLAQFSIIGNETVWFVSVKSVKDVKFFMVECTSPTISPDGYYHPRGIIVTNAPWDRDAPVRLYYVTQGQAVFHPVTFDSLCSNKYSTIAKARKPVDVSLLANCLWHELKAEIGGILYTPKID